MKVDRRPFIQISPAVDAVDARQALQQRALAAAVAPGDPEELAAPTSKEMSLERLEGLVAGAPPRVQRALLERVRALLGHVKGLGDRVDDDRGRGAG